MKNCFGNNRYPNWIYHNTKCVYICVLDIWKWPISMLSFTVVILRTEVTQWTFLVYIHFFCDANSQPPLYFTKQKSYYFQTKNRLNVRNYCVFTYGWYTGQVVPKIVICITNDFKCKTMFYFDILIYIIRPITQINLLHKNTGLHSIWAYVGATRQTSSILSEKLSIQK